METSSATASTHQEEPLDLSVVNQNDQEMTEEAQQTTYQQLMNLFQHQQLMAIILQQVLSQNLLPGLIPDDPVENDTKEIMIIPNKELNMEDNESTPSPTIRRTSTGKIDRRMIGKVCSRRVEANARERNRVQTLSKTFDSLKECLPIEDDIKISKLATLKVACAYIGFLGAVLDENSEEEERYRKILQYEMESAKALRK